MASFLDLPAELIVMILAHLDVRDLAAVADTCHSLNHVINNQELWKNMFKTRFHADHFSSVSRSLKFSVELFRRSELLREWRRARATHLVLPLRTVGTLLSVQLAYPQVLLLHDEGSVYLTQLDRAKPDAEIPVTTAQGSTALWFDPRTAVFGNAQGELFLKPLSRKEMWGNRMALRSKLPGMVTSVYNTATHCYAGDSLGNALVADVKTGDVLHELKLGSRPLAVVRGNKHYLVALDSEKIYIVDETRREEPVRTIQHVGEYDFCEVDFAGKSIVLASTHTVHTFCFEHEWFGSTSSYSVGEGEEVTSIALEQKEFANREWKMAGQDGCNLAVVVSRQRVITFNSRRSRLKLQSEFVPRFADLHVLNPVRSVDVNSSVVLVGAYNGWAAVYDVLTGDFVRMVSSKIFKKHLQTNHQQQRRVFEPVSFVKLAKSNATYGILVVNNVIQFFQFGENATGETQAKKPRKNVAGVVNERKNKFDKSIRTQMYDMDHDEYEQYKKEELLDKYNGADLVNGEDIEMAMALNRSMNEHIRSPGINGGEDEVDEELARALEMSRLEHESSVTYEDGVLGEASGPNAGNDEVLEGEDDEEDEEFKKQLEEAMRRSLYE